jgi:hypothetical protein
MDGGGGGVNGIWVTTEASDLPSHRGWHRADLYP